MTLIYWWAALPVAAIVFLAWLLVFGRTQDRSPHHPDPALHEAQHRVSDSGERDRPGDDDQWRRLQTRVPHIRRLANAENRAENEERLS